MTGFFHILPENMLDKLINEISCVEGGDLNILEEMVSKSAHTVRFGRAMW